MIEKHNFSRSNLWVSTITTKDWSMYVKQQSFTILVSR